jgi:hypothetical protein
VEILQFIEQKYKRLDILINNAAQTVRRPAGFYTHLMENEERSIASLTGTGNYWIIRIVWMKSVDHWFSSNENMPVHLARTRTWNWVAGFRQIIADSLFV